LEPSLKAPEGAERIDLANEWVMPGLVDAHTHITMNLPPAAPGESYWENHLLTETTAFRAERGLYNSQLLLKAGFTALRDVGNNGNYADTAVRPAIEKGWFDGPSIINSGKIIGQFGGQSHDYSPEQGRFWDYEYIDADTPQEIRKAVRENIYYGAKVIKLVADTAAFITAKRTFAPPSMKRIAPDSPLPYTSPRTSLPAPSCSAAPIQSSTANISRRRYSS
jgi:imidazolonepropionase-like amidohydrolase